MDQQSPARTEYKWLPPWNPRAYAAPGSPSGAGYILAVAISLVTVALEAGALDAVRSGAKATVVTSILAVLIFAFIPAVVIGSVGAMLVHFTTRRASTQWPAILTAAIIGFALPLLVLRGNFSGIIEFAVLLGVAAGIGRWAVVPFAVRRGR